VQHSPLVKKTKTPCLLKNLRQWSNFPHQLKHYHPGDTILLSGMASAPEMLHDYDVLIFNKENGDTLFHEHGHAHGTSITFEHKLVNPGDEEYYIQAFIKVYTNHDKDFVADSVDFHYLVK